MNVLLLGLIGGLYVGLLLFVWSLGRMAALSDNRKEGV